MHAWPEEDVLRIWNDAARATNGRRRSAPDETRWFKLSVTAPANERGGVVVAHADVTGRKRAQLELETALAEVSALKDRFETKNRYLTEKIRRERDFGDILGRSVSGCRRARCGTARRGSGSDVRPGRASSIEPGTSRPLAMRARCPRVRTRCPRGSRRTRR